ncbi:calcium uptake protein 3, mitochondrial-like [Topomyia yanbarensis]|uniref:calcium uptake protein 3, mitochondrial-like n=1 Tax=Topomyia yanbarensis TaxID=2498891 RepID=UPI00273B0F6C|nr:calcium uptake protein 3, mitochondrial-like [Topomyia yanbarensis]
MPTPRIKLVCLVGGGFAAVLSYIKARNTLVHHGQDSQHSPLSETAAGLTNRERRFLNFASIECGQQIYMTPQDFLESVLESESKACLKRKILTNDDVMQLHAALQKVKKNSSNLFRKLSEKGIISFTEYLFLLSVLTRPQSGFRVAFNMFDRDGNQQVDRNEFLVIGQLLGRTFKDRKADDNTKKILTRLEPKQKSSLEHVETGQLPTTLQIYFFGRDGSSTLSYDYFNCFMNNLQREVLRIEFERYSRGGIHITDVDFARILLGYTHLKPHEYDKILRRIGSVTNRHLVSFEEFERFCRVLHNLEDFALAMRIFHSVNGTISKDEFARAVRICSGSTMNDHLIDIVFAMFDVDGDGDMSYNELLLVIKNRFRFRNDRKVVGWRAFKRCCRQEIRCSAD